MPRNPNKIKTSLFKAVQKQALLWSDGDLIIWGHQECRALHWHSPCHPAQLCKNWTFRLGKQGSAPHTALPLVFALPSSSFCEIPFVRRMSSQACVSAALQTATAHWDCHFLHQTPSPAASVPWLSFSHHSSKWIPLSATERQKRHSQNFFHFENVGASLLFKLQPWTALLQVTA